MATNELEKKCGNCSHGCSYRELSDKQSDEALAIQGRDDLVYCVPKEDIYDVDVLAHNIKCNDWKEKLSIYIIHESMTLKDIYYFAVGRINHEGKLTGLVYGYEGGGKYSEAYILDGVHMPCRDKDDEPIEDDYIIAMLNQIVGNDSFVKRCVSRAEEFMKYNKDTGIYEAIDADIFIDTLFKDRFGAVPPSYGLISWKETPSKTYSMKEFIETHFDKGTINEVIKETHEQLAIQTEVKAKHIYLLIEETVSTLANDDVYGLVIDSEYARNYLTALTDMITGFDNPFASVNFRECEQCDECGETLMPDDECYSEFGTEAALCTHCCVFDDDKEAYVRNIGGKLNSQESAL